MFCSCTRALDAMLVGSPKRCDSCRTCAQSAEGRDAAAGRSGPSDGHWPGAGGAIQRAHGGAAEPGPCAAAAAQAGPGCRREQQPGVAGCARNPGLRLGLANHVRSLASPFRVLQASWTRRLRRTASSCGRASRRTRAKWRCWPRHARALPCMSASSPSRRSTLVSPDLLASG